MRGYLISMAVRTVCFIAAIVTWHVSRPISVVCFVFAAILPYVAVVYANAVGKRRIDSLGAVTPPPVRHQEISGPSNYAE